MMWMIAMFGVASMIKLKSDETGQEFEYNNYKEIAEDLADTFGFKISRKEEREPEPYPHLADMKDFDYDGWME